MVTYFTLHGKHATLTGDPDAGYTEIKLANVPGNVLRDLAGNVILNGTVRCTYDSNGEFTTSLPVDDGTVVPTGFAYRIDQRPRAGGRKTVTLPAPTVTGTVECADIEDGAAVSAVAASADAVVAGAIGQPMTAAALGTGYAKVVQIVGDGTDKTTAINTALAAANPLGLTVRLIGSITISAPLVIKSGTALDASGATITLASGSNCNMLQNYQVVANNGRDTRITVIGGTWVRGSNAGTGTALHSLCFRRVDGLMVRDLKVTSSAGKYAVNIGDVTSFEVARVDLAAFSDGIHINGPASNGHVHHITGTTGDDTIAITGNDYTAYADVSGNVANVRIDTITTTSTNANLVKVISGSGCDADRVTVSRITGTSALHGVWLGDDTGTANTTGGTYGDIDIEDIRATTTQQQVRLITPAAKRIRVRSKHSGSTVFCQITGTSTVTIGLLRLDLECDTTGRAFFVDTGVTTLTVDRLELGGRYVYNGSGQLVRVETGTINELVLDGKYTGTGQTGFVVQQVAATTQTIKRVEARGSFTTFDGVYRSSPSAAPATLVVSGVVKSCKRIHQASNGAAQVILQAPTIDSMALEAFYCASASMRITGAFGVLLSPYAGGLIGRSASETIGVNVIDMPVDVTKLTGVAGDKVTNTNGSHGAGTGVLLSNGTLWKNLYTGTAA